MALLLAVAELAAVAAAFGACLWLLLAWYAHRLRQIRDTYAAEIEAINERYEAQAKAIMALYMPGDAASGKLEP